MMVVMVMVLPMVVSMVMVATMVMVVVMVMMARMHTVAVVRMADQVSIRGASQVGTDSAHLVVETTTHGGGQSTGGIELTSTNNIERARYVVLVAEDHIG